MMLFSWTLLFSVIAGFLSVKVYDYFFIIELGYWPEYVIASTVASIVTMTIVQYRYGGVYQDLINLRSSDELHTNIKKTKNSIEQSSEHLRHHQRMMILEIQNDKITIDQVILHRQEQMMGDLNDQDWSGVAQDLGKIKHKLEDLSANVRKKDRAFHQLLSEQTSNLIVTTNNIQSTASAMYGEIHAAEKKLM